jgi:ADYC domain
MHYERAVLLVLLSTVPGCALSAAEDLAEDELEYVGEVTSPVVSTNGMSLNGMSLNGMSLNGMSLNGMSLNGMSLNGMSLNGMSLNGMSLNGSELAGTAESGEVLAGQELIGAHMSGLLSDGSTLLMRIDDAEPLPGPNSDVWAYQVSYALQGGIWSPLCGVSGGAPIGAVALAGTWNLGSGVAGGGSWSASASSFTFACRGAALAKCVELGYKPWQAVSGAPLQDHHQACTRMIRADYCGDGTAWTADGVLINLYDNLGIQADEASWKTDAEWLPGGARCYHKLRDFQHGKPTCKHLKSPHCGTFDDGALLVSEYKK